MRACGPRRAPCRSAGVGTGRRHSHPQVSVTRTPATPAAPFSRIKIRTGALVFCRGDVALIHRDRAASIRYTPPGGNVEEHGEDLTSALCRELAEELGLDTEQADGSDLLWVIDQRVTRPGLTPPPRKLHVIYCLHTTPNLRCAPDAPDIASTAARQGSDRPTSMMRSRS
ncbi:NUDIX hydrolase [Streptomyces sp. NPDC059989]|uniref:NUDIX hydrolase n=1 Tax=Streptomyces sp. NPDC059989 TaxID=3347026 RepID=UPI0036BF598F